MKDQFIRIRVIVENTANRKGLLGEHGLSYAIEKNGQTILFDTGAGLALANNAAAMGIDLARIDTIGLSHGHFDHVGGLIFFEERNIFPRLYAHPDAFQPKFSKRDNQKYYEIGLSSVDGLSSERFRECLVPVEEPTEIIQGLWLTGPIPKTYEFENWPGDFFLDGRGERRDDLIDDQSLFFISKKGVVVILGCAHSGAINTLQYIRSKTGDLPIHHVMGGMHLLNASKDRIQSTIAELRRLDIEWISPCHCTGLPATLALHNAFGDRFKACSVGEEFRFNVE